MAPSLFSGIDVQTILTPVSIGELIDKITILEIKAERIADAAKLGNVRTELDGLWPLWLQQQATRPELATLKQQLKAINERMWDIQDQLRAKETAQDFGAEFITLARGVYGTNSERVVVKNEINRIAVDTARGMHESAIAVQDLARLAHDLNTLLEKLQS